MSDTSLPNYLVEVLQRMATKLAENARCEAKTYYPPGCGRTRHIFKVAMVTGILDNYVENAEIIVEEIMSEHKRELLMAKDTEQLTERHLHAFAALLLETLFKPDPALRRIMIDDHLADDHTLTKTVNREFLADDSELMKAWIKDMMEQNLIVTKDDPFIAKLRAKLIHNISEGMEKMENTICASFFYEEEEAHYDLPSMVSM